MQIQPYYMQEYSKCKDFVKHLWFVAIGLVGFIFYHQQGIQLESRMVYTYIYTYAHDCLSCLHVQSIPIAHRKTCSSYSMCMNFVKQSEISIKIMLYRHVNTDTNMYVHVCMYNHAYIYTHSFSFICMHVHDAHIYSCIYIIHIFMYI